MKEFISHFPWGFLFFCATITMFIAYIFQWKRSNELQKKFLDTPEGIIAIRNTTIPKALKKATENKETRVILSEFVEFYSREDLEEIDDACDNDPENLCILLIDYIVNIRSKLNAPRI